MYRNSEKYADPMAGTALAHIMYEEKLARRKARQKERKDGECVISKRSANLRHCGKQQRSLAEQSTLVVSGVIFDNPQDALEGPTKEEAP